MSIWSIIKMFATFIRELLFDSKDELDYNSSKFNPKKVMLFAIFLVLAVAVMLMFYRLINQSIYVVNLKDAIVAHTIVENKTQENSKLEKESCIRVQEYVRNLPANVKKSNPVPSDSGNKVEKTTPTSKKDKAVEEDKDSSTQTPVAEPISASQRRDYLSKYGIK